MTSSRWIAFQGDRCIAEGGLREVAGEVKRAADGDHAGALLVFDAETSEPVDLDLRGTSADVLARLPDPDIHAAAPDPAGEPARRGPGRPKLGVVAREITLLPRHWDWLALQPGGASVAIRRLVEDARKAHGARDRARTAQEAAYRFAAAMAGDLPHYEDAMRALFAADATRFTELTQAWPADIRDHARRLAAAAFLAAHAPAAS